MRYSYVIGATLVAAFVVALFVASALASKRIRFTEHLISDDYTYPFGVQAADLDGDGDLDLTSADALPHNNLYWFENDGSGRFTRRFIQKDDPERLERHVIADVDEDGDPDVVIVENRYGDVKWFENSGTPVDGELWARHYITLRGMPHAYEVELADLDRDGDLDVAATSGTANSLAWFENDGTPGDEGEWEKRELDSAASDPKMLDTRTVRAADFDGDNDPDLLVTARLGGLIVWYENSGRPQTAGWKKHLINGKASFATHGQPVDLDGDGDLDVLMAEGFNSSNPSNAAGVVVWYENNGKPAAGNWPRRVVGPQSQAFEAVAQDLDGDGDTDVAATGWINRGQLAWFESTGNPPREWRKHVVKDNWLRANQVIVADLDGDRRPDLVACAERGSLELRWWRNDGIDD